ncbi:hypothetical protein [Salmonirosea aquatica]|uniref:Uncharacterized protein n=1 Tax=Salmonirosea aquatica TaxID=2654236 RepID=A0A7C9BJZ8_9BACT|nr:hypothetical protein [Cytophagaceae bacterium SJW1-29]MPR37141.1 hypothetical protein [Cytophagaceae bacterium SJW1-29]
MDYSNYTTVEGRLDQMVNQVGKIGLHGLVSLFLEQSFIIAEHVEGWNFTEVEKAATRERAVSTLLAKSLDLWKVADRIEQLDSAELKKQARTF